VTEFSDDDADDHETIDSDTPAVPLWINRWRTLAVTLTLAISVIALLVTLAATAWFAVSPESLARIPGAGAGVIVVGLLGPPALIGLMLFASRILVRDDWPVAQSLGGLMLIAGLILGGTVGAQWDSVIADPGTLAVCIPLTLLLIFAGGGKLVWGIAAMPRFTASRIEESEPIKKNGPASADRQKADPESARQQSLPEVSESRD